MVRVQAPSAPLWYHRTSSRVRCVVSNDDDEFLIPRFSTGPDKVELVVQG
jgi:hypothetical protein